MTELGEVEEPTEKPRHVQILDELIDKLYREIKNQKIQEVKIGDLLKMMETRRKLSPEGGDQKKFWKMIDDIRRESLEKPKPKTKPKPRQRTVAKKGTKSVSK